VQICKCADDLDAFMETFDIINNIEIGRQIFEKVPNDIRPGWSGLILSRFDSYLENIPTQVKDLYFIIDNPDKWKEAHNQFSKIRRFNLDNKDYQPESYLLLAEMVTKVTYNTTNLPAPFDADNGWYIPSLALKAAQYIIDHQAEDEKDDYIMDEVKSAILIFHRNEKFRYNLTTAKDFIIYKKIDDILWFDWDPIGVNEFAPRDEYQSYVPEVFRLRKSNANKEEIAKRLLELETKTMGVSGNFERCLIIADKIIHIM
jgi:hypothetical protein